MRRTQRRAALLLFVFGSLLVPEGLGASHIRLLAAHRLYISQTCLLGERSLLLVKHKSIIRQAIERLDSRREEITRSRLPVASNRNFQPANWQGEIAFLEACGLRRSEAAALRVNEVIPQLGGEVYILVRRGKGGRQRIVPVLPGSEEAVLSYIKDRNDPEGRANFRDGMALIREHLPGQ